MFDDPRLAALAAVIRLGSFEAAARALAITPPAVSQRIRQLEESLGTVLLIRSQPVRATAPGLRLYRHFNEVSLLGQALAGDLAAHVPIAQGRPAVIPLAVNADSLATWFIGAMVRAGDARFEIIIDDQDFSADWLRRGEVLGAVTSDGAPVQGCDAVALGRLRYIATASPQFAARWFAEGASCAAFAAAPALIYSRKDRLQAAWVRRETGAAVHLTGHLLPSSQGFVEAALAGLGWGLNPEPLVRAHLAAGRLVAIGADPVFEVPLFWQFNRVARRALAALTRAVRAAAGEVLIAGGDAGAERAAAGRNAEEE